MTTNKTCVKGYSCGATCISRDRNCSKILEPKVGEFTNKVVNIVNKGNSTASPKTATTVAKGGHEDVPELLEYGADISKLKDQKSLKTSLDVVMQKSGMNLKEAKASIQAIRSFTGPQSRYQEIRSGEDKQTAADLNRYINTMPRYEGQISRGLSFTDKKIAQSFLKELTGNGLELKAMSSFSSNEDHSRKFANRATKKGGFGILMKVTNKSGTSIKPLSNTPFEDEIVAPEGARYRVKPGQKPKLKAGGILEIEVEEY